MLANYFYESFIEGRILSSVEISIFLGGLFAVKNDFLEVASYFSSELLLIFGIGFF